MRRARLGLAVAALAGTAGSPTAHADKGGPVAFDRHLALGFQLGGLRNQLPPAADGAVAMPSDLDGSATFFRLRGGGYEGPTHYGHRYGLEGGMTIGWIDRAAFVPVDADGMEIPGGATPVWGRLHLDFDVALLVDVLSMPPNRVLPPLRFTGLGGFGLSTDFAYFFLGGRLSGKLGGLRGELEYHRRFGESHSDPNQREERFHLMVFFRSYGFGIENWHGYSEDATGQAATDRVFRGGYGVTMLNLMWVPK